MPNEQNKEREAQKLRGSKDYKRVLRGREINCSQKSKHTI